MSNWGNLSSSGRVRRLCRQVFLVCIFIVMLPQYWRFLFFLRRFNVCLKYHPLNCWTIFFPGNSQSKKKSQGVNSHHLSWNELAPVVTNHQSLLQFCNYGLFKYAVIVVSRGCWSYQCENFVAG